MTIPGSILSFPTARLLMIFLFFLLNRQASSQEIIIEKSKYLHLIVNKFISFPLKTGNLPDEEGFEILSYRSGLSEEDDYFQLNGHNEGGRSGYHLNSILKLRMAGGHYLLDGINNDIDITCNGMNDSIVPQIAALKKGLVMDDLAFIRSEVPDMTNSMWQRNMLFIKGTGLIVIDRTTSRKTSEFEIECSWTLPKDHMDISFDPEAVKTGGGTVISFANQGRFQFERVNIIKQAFAVRLLKDDFYDIGNLIYHNSDSSILQNIKKTGKNHFLVSGRKSIFIGLGEGRIEGLEVNSAFFSVEPERIFSDGFEKLVIGNLVTIKSDTPVSLTWNTTNNKLIINSPAHGTLSYETDTEKYIIAFSPGNNVFEDIYATGMNEKITSIMGGLKNNLYHDPLPFFKKDLQKVDWLP